MPIRGSESDTGKQGQARSWKPTRDNLKRRELPPKSLMAEYDARSQHIYKYGSAYCRESKLNQNPTKLYGERWNIQSPQVAPHASRWPATGENSCSPAGFSTDTQSSALVPWEPWEKW